MRQDGQAPAPPRTSPSSLWQPGIGGPGAGQRRGRAPFIPCRCSCCCSPALSLEQSGSHPLERSAERAHHEARYGRGYRATSTGALGGSPLYLPQSVVGSGQLSLYPETRAGVPAFRESVRERAPEHRFVSMPVGTQLQACARVPGGALRRFRFLVEASRTEGDSSLGLEPQVTKFEAQETVDRLPESGPAGTS